jgi:hypothetical protein
MLSTVNEIHARTCAQTGGGDADSHDTTLKLEAFRRECDELKSAYSKMAAELWGAEQLIEQLEDEVATLKSNAGPLPQLSHPPSPSPPSSPEASSTDSGTREKVAKVPRKPRSASAYATLAPRIPSERTPREAQFEGVPFFDHFGITNSRELHQKLAAFLIDRDPTINTDDKRRLRTNQSKFKADQFLRLLWLEAPGTPPPYTPGDVDEFFAFFDPHRGHEDMGKHRTFHSHDHRVGTWLWPSKVTDYASFNAESNKYVARQARGALTGVRAVHGLYEIFRGDASWHVAERHAPVSDNAAVAANPNKKRKVRAKSSPPGGDGKRKRGPKRASVDADDEESYVSSSGDESPEEHWSCADDDTDNEGRRN